MKLLIVGVVLECSIQPLNPAMEKWPIVIILLRSFVALVADLTRFRCY